MIVVIRAAVSCDTLVDPNAIGTIRSLLGNHRDVIATARHHFIVFFDALHIHHTCMFKIDQDPTLCQIKIKPRLHSYILTTIVLNSANRALIRGSDVFVEMQGWREERRTTSWIIISIFMKRRSFGSLVSLNISEHLMIQNFRHPT